jgi:hypothetical protein
MIPPPHRLMIEFSLEEIENFLATFFGDGAGKNVYNSAHRQAVLVKLDRAVEEATTSGGTNERRG